MLTNHSWFAAASLQDAIDGHAAVVEVTENFDFVIDLGHGDSVQDRLVHVSAGGGKTIGVLAGIDQMERSEIIVSALLAYAGLAFTDADNFRFGSHCVFLLDLNISFVVYWIWTIQ